MRLDAAKVIEACIALNHCSHAGRGLAGQHTPSRTDPCGRHETEQPDVGPDVHKYLPRMQQQPRQIELRVAHPVPKQPESETCSQVCDDTRSSVVERDGGLTKERDTTPCQARRHPAGAREGLAPPCRFPDEPQESHGSTSPAPAGPRSENPRL